MSCHHVVIDAYTNAPPEAQGCLPHTGLNVMLVIGVALFLLILGWAAWKLAQANRDTPMTLR